MYCTFSWYQECKYVNTVWNVEALKGQFLCFCCLKEQKSRYTHKHARTYMYLLSSLFLHIFLHRTHIEHVALNYLLKDGEVPGVCLQDGRLLHLVVSCLPSDPPTPPVNSTHTYSHTHAHAHKGNYFHTCACTHTHTRTLMHTTAITFTRVHAHIHTHAHALTHTCSCTQLQLLSHMCVRAYTHTCTHALSSTVSCDWSKVSGSLCGSQLFSGTSPQPSYATHCRWGFLCPEPWLADCTKVIAFIIPLSPPSLHPKFSMVAQTSPQLCITPLLIAC